MVAREGQSGAGEPADAVPGQEVSLPAPAPAPQQDKPAMTTPEVSVDATGVAGVVVEAIKKHVKGLTGLPKNLAKALPIAVDSLSESALAEIIVRQNYDSAGQFLARFQSEIENPGGHGSGSLVNVILAMIPDVVSVGGQNIQIYGNARNYFLNGTIVTAIAGEMNNRGWLAMPNRPETESKPVTEQQTGSVNASAVNQQMVTANESRKSINGPSTRVNLLHTSRAETNKVARNSRIWNIVKNVGYAAAAALGIGAGFFAPGQETGSKVEKAAHQVAASAASAGSSMKPLKPAERANPASSNVVQTGIDQTKNPLKVQAGKTYTFKFSPTFFTGISRDYGVENGLSKAARDLQIKLSAPLTAEELGRAGTELNQELAVKIALKRMLACKSRSEAYKWAEARNAQFTSVDHNGLFSADPKKLEQNIRHLRGILGVEEMDASKRAPARFSIPEKNDTSATDAQKTAWDDYTRNNGAPAAQEYLNLAMKELRHHPVQPGITGKVEDADILKQVYRLAMLMAKSRRLERTTNITIELEDGSFETVQDITQLISAGTLRELNEQKPLKSSILLDLAKEDLKPGKECVTRFAQLVRLAVRIPDRKDVSAPNLCRLPGSNCTHPANGADVGVGVGAGGSAGTGGAGAGGSDTKSNLECVTGTGGNSGAGGSGGANSCLPMDAGAPDFNGSDSGIQGKLYLTPPAGSDLVPGDFVGAPDSVYASTFARTFTLEGRVSQTLATNAQGARIAPVTHSESKAPASVSGHKEGHNRLTYAARNAAGRARVRALGTNVRAAARLRAQEAAESMANVGQTAEQMVDVITQDVSAQAQAATVARYEVAAVEKAADFAARMTSSEETIASYEAASAQTLADFEARMTPEIAEDDRAIALDVENDPDVEVYEKDGSRVLFDRDIEIIEDGSAHYSTEPLRVADVVYDNTPANDTVPADVAVAA